MAKWFAFGGAQFERRKLAAIFAYIVNRNDLYCLFSASVVFIFYSIFSIFDICYIFCYFSCSMT